MALQAHLTAGKAPPPLPKAPAAAAPAKPAAAAPTARKAAPAGSEPAPAAGPAALWDEEGALALVQWVQSTKPADAAQAEQVLRDALLRVDPCPAGPPAGASLRIVARIGWAAAAQGLVGLADVCASRAACSQVRWICWLRVCCSLTGMLDTLHHAGGHSGLKFLTKPCSCRLRGLVHGQT